MITVEDRGNHVLESDEYTIKGGYGFMGDTIVLTAHNGPFWLKGKSFRGDADELERDGSQIKVVMVQSWFSLWGIERPIGKPSYIMIQNGRSVLMYEGGADDIKINMLIITDNGRVTA